MVLSGAELGQWFLNPRETKAPNPAEVSTEDLLSHLSHFPSPEEPNLRELPCSDGAAKSTGSTQVAGDWFEGWY